jgi:hypothetical protein
MPKIMKSNALPIAVSTAEDPIADACGDRATDHSREIKQRYREHRAAYAGGLPAEQQTLKNLASATALELRQNHLRQIGRPIDLKALLGQRDAKRRPIWTVANPLQPIDTYNGCVKNDGDVLVQGKGTRRISTGKATHSGKDFVPTGFPALPDKARKIIRNERLQQYAAWIGVLYQPDGWAEKKDPAVIVEWTDLPGEYFCLAIWGGDRAQIEEFVE